MDDHDATLTVAEHQSLTARYGANVKVWDLNGRRFAVRAPKRAEWQAYKCDQQSGDPTTKADAQVLLARAVLVPVDPDGSVDAERKAFDALGDEYPALLDLLGALADSLGAGPLGVREVKPPSSTPRVSETPTSPPTP